VEYKLDPLLESDAVLFDLEKVPIFGTNALLRFSIQKIEKNEVVQNFCIYLPNCTRSAELNSF